MADARVDRVADVLRDNGHNATGSGATLDDLATMIVNALDELAATGQADEIAADETAAADPASSSSAANPETPAGTGTEGGTVPPDA